MALDIVEKVQVLPKDDKAVEKELNFAGRSE